MCYKQGISLLPYGLIVVICANKFQGNQSLCNLAIHMAQICVDTMETIMDIAAEPTSCKKGSWSAVKAYNQLTQEFLRSFHFAISMKVVTVKTKLTPWAQCALLREKRFSGIKNPCFL